MADVPNAPGVPALPSFSPGQVALLAADAVLIGATALQPLWGIYLNGAPVLASSLASLLGLGALANAVNSVSSLLGGANVANLFSVVDFEYKQDWAVSDYQVEEGAFQSYNKVQNPFDVRMRIAAGGTASNRQALLDIVDAASNSLDLFDVVTPEKIYESCNIDHYDYKRSAGSGLGVIVIDVWLKEIRVTATATFQNTQQPTAAGQQNVGSVQPQPATPALQSFATSGSFF